MTCSWCHRPFDVTGGGDGTWSTVDGRLKRVADAARSVRNTLAHASAAEVDELRQLLTDLQAASAFQVQEALRRNPGRFPKFEEWAAHNPGLLLVLLSALPVLLYILTVLAPTEDPPVVVNVTTPPPAAGMLDDEAIERVVRETIRTTQRQPAAHETVRNGKEKE